ncbi:MAG: hypothetical protein GY938_12810 [Ketobacter sp.]|nr:hypothetical protein [Ketobacter sp.]
MNKRLCHETALVAVMMSSVVLNEFCMKYPVTIQLECAQRLGGRLHCEKYTGDIIDDIKGSISGATFSKPKSYGFDAVTYTSRKRGFGGDRKGKKGGMKRQRIDFTVFKDKNSAKFVPKGFCMWKFGVGKCEKSDSECKHSHVRWTEAELAAAKAS